MALNTKPKGLDFMDHLYEYSIDSFIEQRLAK